MKKTPVLASCLIFSCLIATSCSQKMETTSFTAMNTYMTVRSYGRSAKAANLQVQKEVERLEGILSTTIEGSDVYRINTSKAETDGFSKIPVMPETTYLIQKSLRFYEMTEGSFNPALYPIIREWGFTTGDYKVPSEEKILSLLKYTDFSKIEISEKLQSATPLDSILQADHDKADQSTASILTCPAGMQLDFGAIGKGYAGDCAIRLLKENGVKSALLDFGGNIQVFGSKPDGSDWTVGIKNPWGGDPVAAVKLRDACMITSGGYERFFTGEDGKKYIHIFDGTTGRPVENELESVTIICRQGIYGDALSTSLFVMGLDKAIEFWRSRDGDFDFIILTKDKGVVYSAPLKNSISLRFDFDSIQVVE
ncbi:thiamine biosynthesis lipoprotein [Treponema bryantii]|uniref:FAD:protein FMN transferase n=1 Tax=Treponema bryantii TaxID=163 RepID=A0A1I3HW34_9SPIR|nr:FAD:protein FMN transferase [Treponema bryantii]SFI39891.1 thiamine biosynthesis lipoprotein [Treponema bryantii]